MSARFYELHDGQDFDKAELLAALGKKKPSIPTMRRFFGPEAVLAYREVTKDEQGNPVTSRPVCIGSLG